MSNTNVSVYTTSVEGVVLYSGESLEEALRTWDANTYNLGKSVPGGVGVETFAGDVMIRDGWVLHVTPDGVTYVNPRLTLA